MTRMRGSRAVSVPKASATITEVMNGLIVTRPANKIEYVGDPNQKNESEPIVIELKEHGRSMAASV